MQTTLLQDREFEAMYISYYNDKGKLFGVVFTIIS